MKNLLIVFLSLLVLASCRKKEDEPVAVEGVSLSPTASVILNGTNELKAVVSPVNAADQSLSWYSENDKVATVDQNGVVTGKALGKTVIVATSKSNPGKFAKCEVQVVKKKVASITITPKNPVITEGEELELKATILPAEADQTVTWSLRGPAQANFTTAPGTAVKVSTVEAGKVLIVATATDGSNVTGEVTITVQSKSNATITAITLGSENFAVKVPEPGATTTLGNAPRTIATDLTKVPVNITVSAGATIKIGTTDFRSGQTVDFTKSVTFSVTEEGKVGSKSYTLAITPYNKGTNPYGIYNAAHLSDVRNALSEGFKVMNDITMPTAGAGLTGIGDYKDAGWLPIGGQATPFTGSLDGDGHEITYFTNRKQVYVGLFGKVGSGASITKLGVIGVSGAAVKGTLESGYQYTGILAGANEGTIEGCYALGNVSSSSTNAVAGGLVGLNSNSGTIRKCYTSGDVVATATGNGSAIAGGLVGQCQNSTITNCYYYATGANTGMGTGTGTPKVSSRSSIGSSSGSSIAGGLVGEYSGGTINHCYAVGDVYISCDASALRATPLRAYVSGFAGHNSSSTTTTNPPISKCYRKSNASVKINDDEATSGDATGVTPKTLEDMKKDDFTTLLNENNSEVWGRNAGKNDGLPYIKGVGIGK